jgi:UDP-N-acetylmuramate dehydrogenase
MSAEPKTGTAPAGLRGALRLNEPMWRHTAWGVGGPAARFYQPADVDDLCAFLATLDAEEPLLWVGLGSNLLVRDGGIPGTVVKTTGMLERLAQVGARRVRAEAGVACAKVARFCARRDLGGAEFLAGIPGTMGGALAMNAGAFGGETWDVVRGVETIDRRGVRRTRGAAEYTVGYRRVEGPRDEWFAAAELELAPADGERGLARIRELLRRRDATQPLRQRSCGSVFRNPSGDHAARLIEASGLKGRRIGGAVVSPKHANFIINTGEASAADIEALIGEVVATVAHEHGVTLVPEVHIVGRVRAPEEGRIP